MKKVLLVNVKTAYVSNDTCYLVELSGHDKLLDRLFGDKYTMVQLYTPITTIQGKTYRELDTKISQFSEANKVYDFESIIIKK